LNLPIINSYTAIMKKLIYLLCGLLYTSIIFGHPPWGIAVDNEKNIYFADIMHHGMGAVYKLTHEGQLEILFKDFHAHNVSLDKNGNLITSHGENNHTMIRLNSDSTIDTLFHTDNHTEFFGGNSSYSPSGEIIFGIEKYFWKINQQGKREKLSEHKFTWNQTIYADEDGNYYGPDIGEGNGQVIKINKQGQSSIIATDLITKLGRPVDPHNDILMGITKGYDGFIYIAEIAGRRIIKILHNKQTETFYISDEDWFPTAIDFFAGEAFILEYKISGKHRGPRVIKVDESGKRTELFNYSTYWK